MGELQDLLWHGANQRALHVRRCLPLGHTQTDRDGQRDTQREGKRRGLLNNPYSRATLSGLCTRVNQSWWPPQDAWTLVCDKRPFKVRVTKGRVTLWSVDGRGRKAVASRRLTLWRPLWSYWYSYKSPCVRRDKPVICNFWHPGTLTLWAWECPDVKNCKWPAYPVWHRVIYSCTLMTKVGVKGLIDVTAEA